MPFLNKKWMSQTCNHVPDDIVLEKKTVEVDLT